MDQDSDMHATPHLFGKWRFSVLISIVFLTIIAYFLFSLWAGWEKVSFAIEKIGLIGFLVPMSLACCAYLSRFIRWTKFLNILGYHLPLIPSLRIYIGGFTFSVTPGKTGEALRGIFLKDYGISYRQSFGAFLAERFSDVMAVFLLANLGLLCCPQTRPMLLIALFFVTTILLLIQSESFLRKIERWLKKLFPDRFAEHVEFLLETVLSFRKCFSVATLLYGITLGVIAWGLEGTACYYLLQKLGASISFYNVLFIYAFALLVGALTFLPAGLGGAEITLMQLLILYDVPASISVAVTIVIRLTTLWFSVLLGMLFLPRHLLKKV